MFSFFLTLILGYQQYTHVDETYLYVGGDIMLSRAIGEYNRENNYQGFYTDELYHPIREHDECDWGGCVLFFNLESPFHSKHNDYDIPTSTFRSHPDNIQTLLNLKEDNQMVLSTANNHSNNAGYEGITITNNLLQEHGIVSVGSGDTPEQRLPVIIDQNGIRICITAYSYDPYSRHNQLSTYPTGAQLDLLRSDIGYMSAKKCDITILSYHHFGEYIIDANDHKTSQFREYIDMGFDLILGHHGHVPMEIERYNDKYIVYGLGNMLFDQDWGRRNCSEYSTITQMIDGQETCVVPTHIGLNILFKIIKDHNKTSVDVQELKGVETYKSVQSRLDSESEKLLWGRIFPEYFDI